MLGRLLGEYELYILREPAENLNRFLIFIGKPLPARYQLKCHIEGADVGSRSLIQE